LRDYGYGIYIALIFVDSNDCMDAEDRTTHEAVAEAVKQTHSKLCNCFSNAIYRQILHP
jgi:hypothetical protein